INNPLPPNVTQVVNTATFNGDGPQGPIGPVQPTPVITPVGALPALATVKGVANLTRSGGTAKPGDVLEYTVTITNTGNIAATNASLSDPIPANTTYIAGSTRLNDNPAPDIANGAIRINSPGAASGVLNAGAANAATVKFRVTINNPFPENVTQVVNQATANAQGPNGEPVGAPSNPVITPIGANPLLTAVKSVANLTRPTGTALPDDVLEYTITVTNIGDTASTGTMFRDAVPANTVYVAGSTTVNASPAPDITSGAISISSPGAPAARVNVGGAASAVVRFRVRIVNPLPVGVTQVVNQASVSGNGPGGPIGSVDSNPVITPVGGAPSLLPVKSVVNLTRGGGLAVPGDLLEYTITVTNTGNTASTATTLRDSIPANTTYVAGSTALNGFSAPNLPGPIPINSPGAPSGVLNPGAAAAAVVRFRVTINTPLPAGVAQIVNQASVTGNGPGGSIGPVDSNPVVTPVGATPVLRAVKSVVNLNNPNARPGDVLEYTIVITNTGNTTSVNTSFRDAIPQYTTYVAGSTRLNGAPAPDITLGALTVNSPGAPPGHLWTGANNAATVSFRVRIIDLLPPGATQIVNQGTVNGDGQNGSLPPTDTNQVITPLGTDLTIAKTHTGNFTLGATGVFTLTVRNLGPNPTINPITVTDTLPAGLRFISATGTSWTCSANGQIVTCTTQQSVAVGATASDITLTVGVLLNAASPLVNTAGVSYEGDINPGNNSAADTVLIDNGLGVPGGPFPTDSPTSDQKPGSLVIFPVYTSDAVNGNRENTRLALTNIDPKLTAYVHLFFVDGATCAVADQFLCLTPNQTTSFLASDIDPGTTGYVVAVAVDQNGCPVSFNRLIGHESVKFASGHYGEVAAESYAALYNGTLPGCTINSNQAVLNLDGVQYNLSARVLGLSNLPSPADNNSTLLVVSRTGGNLSTGAALLGAVNGLLYDDREASYSFAATISACQLRQTLSNNFPRTTPRLSQAIPAGRSGWIKLATATEAGMIGVAFNLNTGAKANSNAYNGGYSLHRLRLTTDSYVIPVFPPSCR
ncbi:MAG TPA: hypothetical protein PLQ88_19675, partial [Blastocatellia bacterium]|nr:hypothetical protein [Blastocatellia bacterium]